ncbi:MAG: phage portal protein [Oligoflexus sp.]
MYKNRERPCFTEWLQRTKGWKNLSSSINSESERSLATIVSRSRYLAINNPYAKRGVNAIPSHVVRRGIIPNLPGTSKLEAALKEWAGSNACDFDGRHNLYGLQWLAMKAIVESGEVLIRRRLTKLDSRLDVPLQLQVLEPDFLDFGKPGTKQGIEFDSYGRRVAYWLFEEHPAEAGSKNRSSIRVPAADIIHAFETIRPGQIRGIPWLTPIIIRLKDFDEYEDAQLVRQKIAACLVGVIHDMEMDEPAGKIKEDEWSTFSPGSWEILPPGKTVTFNNPPTVQGYGEYTSQQLHAISAGLMLPYEVLTNDYSQVNFSSSRMSLLEFYKSVEHWQWHIMIQQVCNPIYGWFKDVAAILGIGNDATPVTWGLPKREYVDPMKEIKAQILSIRAGLTTLSNELRKSGEDPKELFEEYASDLALLDELGITLDSDPRIQRAIEETNERD